VIFVFFCGKSMFGCGWPRWAFCAFLRQIRPVLRPVRRRGMLSKIQKKGVDIPRQLCKGFTHNERGVPLLASCGFDVFAPAQLS
jgi:hypothetical protein